MCCRLSSDAVRYERRWEVGMCVAITVLQTHHQVRVMAEGGDGVVGGGRDSVVTEECLQELLDFFVKSAYRAKTVDRRVSTVYTVCYEQCS